jgi:hypothetical protein
LTGRERHRDIEGYQRMTREEPCWHRLSVKSRAYSAFTETILVLNLKGEVDSKLQACKTNRGIDPLVVISNGKPMTLL